LGLVKAVKLRQQAVQALDLVNVQLAPDSLVIHLSAAHQKLVEIAKALATTPDILVVDEPTAPLTKQETHDFFQVLRTLKARSTTIIYISHRLEEIFQLADRVTVLKDGKNVATKEIGETDEDDVIRMMIGRELGDMFPEKTRHLKEENILSVCHLSCKDDLFDIHFDLRKGEILGIAGLEGQGQDILLKTIFGVFQKDKGEIKVDGKSVIIDSPGQAIKVGMALVTDKRGAEGLCLNLSVRDNLALPTLKTRQQFSIINRKQEGATVEKIATDLNIQTPSLRKLVKFLSGGNQQKTVVGKWLIGQPRIMLFIDPTVGIDVGAKTEMYKLMRELVAESDLGVVVVTSDMLELLGLCDRILVMYQGQIVSEMLGKDATEEEIMRAAVGRAQQINGNSVSGKNEEDTQCDG
jgi:ribose transport system ATP-binding protein